VKQERIVLAVLTVVLLGRHLLLSLERFSAAQHAAPIPVQEEGIHINFIVVLGVRWRCVCPVEMTEFVSKFLKLLVGRTMNVVFQRIVLMSRLKMLVGKTWLVL
jgi:hypothetical protein